MACERYRDALSELAAGAAAPTDLDAHLESCASCRAELAERRQALAAVDEELALLTEVEPSPGLQARIRRAVAAEPVGSWRLGWLWPAGATAAAALLVAFLVLLGRAPSRPPAVAHDSGPASAAPVPVRENTTAAAPAAATPAGSGPAPAPFEAAPQRRNAGRRRAAPSEPEVLVPSGEADALLRLAALVGHEGQAPSALGAVGEPSPELVQLRVIDLKPLEIVPLDPAEFSGTQE